NAFMDSMVHFRRQLGYPGLTINWGVWAEAGMAARMDDRDRHRIGAAGFGSIDSKAGLEILGRVMHSDSTQIGVIPADWSKVVPSLFDVPPPLFANLVTRRKETQERFPALLARTAPEHRRKRLEDRLRELISAVMGTDPFPSTDNDISFFELGMDSLMSLDLRNRLQADIDHALPSTVAFEHPSVSDLANFLITTILPAGMVPPELQERSNVREEMAEPKVH
ncbi:MAG TPA: beta-ketoacyl reductase, partial [Thermoanaerobaculia bacterium]|nr:beta-ketoacyl reductase [Thermoanaerobaculia bacterium]